MLHSCCDQEVLLTVLGSYFVLFKYVMGRIVTCFRVKYDSINNYLNVCFCIICYMLST